MDGIYTDCIEKEKKCRGMRRNTHIHAYIHTYICTDTHMARIRKKNYGEYGDRQQDDLISLIYNE
jgi:hypothetical protein